MLLLLFMGDHEFVGVHVYDCVVTCVCVCVGVYEFVGIVKNSMSYVTYLVREVYRNECSSSV